MDSLALQGHLGKVSEKAIRMAPRFKWLRDLGRFGVFVANLLSALVTLWPAVMSAIFAALLATFQWAREFVLSPPILTAAAVWLVLWWTYLGFRFLAYQREPRIVQAHHDYRYGLIFEGLKPVFNDEDFMLEDSRGTLLFLIDLKNFSTGPIRYAVETCDIQFGTIHNPKYKPKSATAYMARGAGRRSSPEAFPRGTFDKYYGKGELDGTADIIIVYGPPDGPPVRRLTLNLEVKLIFPANGKGALGYGDNIVLEKDEAI